MMVAVTAAAYLIFYGNFRLSAPNLFSSRSTAYKNQTHMTAAFQTNRACISCHGDMQTRDTPFHRRHLSQAFIELTCSSCHKSIGAKKRGVKGKTMIDRTVCKICHRQRFAALTPDHEKDDWISRHKQLKRINKDECYVCHKYKELDFCSDCHDSHPTGDRWVFGKHGKVAVAENFSCLQCHDKKTWCTTECHEGITLPHNIPRWAEHWKDELSAPKWREVHFLEARKGGGPERCSRCHEGSDNTGSCQQCHHQQFNPDGAWVSSSPGDSQHPNIVKKLGVPACLDHHTPVFCPRCHIRGPQAYRENYLRNEL